MEKEAVKKTHNATSIILVIAGLIFLFTQFMYFGILFIALGIIFSLLCRTKSLEKALEIDKPLSMSILVFAIMGIIGFPITVMFYNAHLKVIILIWIAAFVIYYFFVSSFLRKGK